MSSSSWRDTYSLHGGQAWRSIQQCKYNKRIVLWRGDAGSWDFPPLAPIIASSIWDVSGSDRRCLIMTSSLLHGRQIGSTCWICAVSRFCRPGSLSSFDLAWWSLPLSLTRALFVFSSSFLFFLQLVGPVLLRWICQVLSSSHPGLSSSVSALVLYFVSPVTLCFQISSLPTAQIITAPLGEAVYSCISRGIIRGGVSMLKKKKKKTSYW